MNDLQDHKKFTPPSHPYNVIFPHRLWNFIYPHKSFLIYILLLLYIAIATIELSIPGIEYDEVLFVNAALGGINNTFIYLSLFHHIPILIFPYIGALKSFVFAPIFKLFGISVFTIRFPVLIITAGSLLLYYLCIKKIANTFLALLSISFLIFDPSFIIHTRLDVGPSVLELFFKVLSLFFFYLFLSKEKLVYIILVFLSLWLGIYNKVNFIWFINAFILAAGITYRKRLFTLLQNATFEFRIKFIFIIFIGYDLTILYYLFLTNYFHLYHEVNLSLLITRIPLTITNLIQLLNGSTFYTYAFGTMSRPFVILYDGILLGIICLSIAMFLLKRVYNPKIQLLYSFLFLLIILTLVQIMVTIPAVHSWHYFTIYPFIWTLISITIFQLYRIQFKYAFLSRCFLGILVLFIIGYQLYTYTWYLAIFNAPVQNTFYSRQIYNLISYTKEKPYTFVSVDWGTGNPILDFDPNGEKYLDLWTVFRSHSDKALAPYLPILQSKNTVFIIYPPSSSSDQPNNMQTQFFFAYTRKYHIHLQKIKEYTDSGKVIYALYKVI